MKKILSIFISIASLGVFAQSSNVETVGVFLSRSELTLIEMEDAKKAIDAAAVHEDTKNLAKMWFFRAALYDTLYKNPLFAGIDPDGTEKFAIACMKCMETDIKKRYIDYCEYAIVNSAFAAYNEAFKNGEAANYAKANMFYQMVLDVLPFDKNKDMEKNDITEKRVLFNMMYFSMKSKDVINSKKYLLRLIELNYEDHLLFIYLSNIYLEEKDTANAIKYIEQGRIKYPNEKDLINSELNIYIVQGKQDVLLKKIEFATEQKPDDPDLIYIRGNMYDSYSSDLLKRAKILSDSSNKPNKLSKNELNTQKKKSILDNCKSLTTQAQIFMNSSLEYTAKAEKDYITALEINPDMIDALYNLGALNNNKSNSITEKIKAIESKSQAEYDKKYSVFKKTQDSILYVSLSYFSKALEIVETKSESDKPKKIFKYGYLKDIFYNIQMLYASLNKQDKFIEFKKRKDEATAMYKSLTTE